MLSSLVCVARYLGVLWCPSSVFTRQEKRDVISIMRQSFFSQAGPLSGLKVRPRRGSARVSS